jgi:hypothetical protein
MGFTGVFNKRIVNIRKERNKVVRNIRKQAGVRERAARGKVLVSGIRTGKSKRRREKRQRKALKEALAKGLLDTEMGEGEEQGLGASATENN